MTLEEEIEQNKRLRLCACGQYKRNWQICCGFCFSLLSSDTQTKMKALGFGPDRRPVTPTKELLEAALKEHATVIAELEEARKTGVINTDGMDERWALCKIQNFCNRGVQIDKGLFAKAKANADKHGAKRKGIHGGIVVSRMNIENGLSRVRVQGGAYSNVR